MGTRPGEFGSFGRITLTTISPSCCAPLPSGDEMRRCDRNAMEGGTSSILLMERAGRVCIEELLARYPRISRVLVLCGPGNNGGDGLEISAGLLSRGISVCTVATVASAYSDEWKDRAARLSELYFFPSLPPEKQLPIGVPVTARLSVEQLTERVRWADVIVDAVLGVGQRGGPRGAVAELLEVVSREVACPVLAVDTPTGINADTGEVFRPHLEASVTIAIQAIKRGLLQFPGRDICGDLVARDIGIEMTTRVETSLPLVEFELYNGESEPLEVHPKVDGHKGERGHVLIVGGSLDMPGAPALATLSALRSGAGLVTVVSRTSWDTFRYVPPEAMRLTLRGDAESFLFQELNAIEPMLSKVGSVVIGPGLGGSERYPGLRQFTLGLLRLISAAGIPAVVDASALEHIAGEILPKDLSRVVITPHPGEAARLLGGTSSSVQRDRFTAVRALAQRTGATALLKGAGTLVYERDRGALVARGTPYLATAGSGDVLSGMIGCYLAQGVPTFRAGCMAAHRHAVAGEKLAQQGTSFTASDLANSLG